jgi:1-deoxy-D-xylulose-5-phosphate reductoisomerase
MKRIAILGSTGSIGQNTLKVAARLPGEFEVVALSTNSNTAILHQQIKRFSPRIVAVRDSSCAQDLRKKIGNRVRLLAGEKGIIDIIEDKRIDLIVLAISGSAALLPLMKAIDEGKDIALANKEALVMAGDIIMKEAKAKNVKIFPIDSEQSAVWQCLDGKEKKILKKIYLTASGGSLRNLNPRQLKKISLRRVLKHPRWKMGKKVTVDSATLMNKGLEVIESMCLFDVDIKQIEVMIHPEAIIHSMVEFIDGSILAQLSITDMRIPIQYALTYPKRCPSSLPKLDFFKLKSLSFYKPNLNRLPCLKLAYEAAQAGGSMPCVLNSSNEIAVESFLNGRIDFLSISKVIERTLGEHRIMAHPNLEDILQIDSWARGQAYRVIDKLKVNR